MLITYHFPPGQGAGALRWEKLAPLVGERGWGLDVVTVHPTSLPAADWTRVAGLPSNTRVYGVPHRLPLVERLEPPLWGVYRRLRRLVHQSTARVPGTSHANREAWAQADLVPREEVRWRVTALRDYRRAFHAWLAVAHERAWSRAAGAAALRLVQRGVHGAVVTSGPPHFVHDAGGIVSRRTGLPHVVDMRDPWTLNPAMPDRHASPVWLWVSARHERSAVERAALVVTNTEPFRVAMQMRYPHAQGRIITVMNGCDDEPLAPARAARRFTIAFAGSIYIDRNPRIVFRAAARVASELRLTPDLFGLDFLGHADNFGGVPLGVLAREEGIADYVRTHPARPRREALRFLAQASMLLSLPQDTPLNIPSKIFEYMQFNAWLLVLAKRDSATELLLRGTGADVVDPDDLEGVVAVVRRRYLQFAAGEQPARVVTDGRFSRRVQARVLFEALAERVGLDRATR